MSILMLVVMALLFAALSPGVLIWLPFGASRRVAALVHGLVFAVVWHFLHQPIAQLLSSFEGMAESIMDDKKKK